VYSCCHLDQRKYKPSIVLSCSGCCGWRISGDRTPQLPCELGMTQFGVGIVTDDRAIDNHSQFINLNSDAVLGIVRGPCVPSVNTDLVLT
jgi:hypothetical protein